jgi:hypothetical protein
MRDKTRYDMLLCCYVMCVECSLLMDLYERQDQVCNTCIGVVSVVSQYNCDYYYDT